MNGKNGLNRRGFLGGVGAAATTGMAFPTLVPARALGRGGVAAPSERITMGAIGVGPRCTYDLKAMLKEPDVEFVAVCDVQADRRAAAKALVDGQYNNTNCKAYRDLREVLARPDIDAVIIATGDRWHATASMMAARAGKDIYCEKPCGLTIGLCQKLDETIRQTNRVFQAGTQRRSVTNFVKAVELAQSGKLGKLKRLYASVYHPAVLTDWLPTEQAPAVDVLDWDLWLGPAPWRPFNIKYAQGGWRGYWDFESGARLLDWGAHTVDLCQWANKADETLPLTYRFDPSEMRVHCTYANGVELILDCLATPFGERPGWVQNLGTCPVRFEGEEGSIEVGDSGGTVIKPASLEASLRPAVADAVADGLDVGAHARNFFDCVKTRGTPVANSRVMRRSHIASHAAALSFILGRALTIDPATEQFVNDAEANSLRNRPERGPWIS